MTTWGLVCSWAALLLPKCYPYAFSKHSSKLKIVDNEVSSKGAGDIISITEKPFSVSVFDRLSIRFLKITTMQQKQKLPISHCLEKSLRLEAKIFMVLIFLVFGGISSQAQSNADLPKYINTGNTHQDAERYKKAKETWEAKNSKNAQVSPQISSEITISMEAYNKLSSGQQAEIKANPNTYKIQSKLGTATGKGQVSRKALRDMSPEKAAYIEENPNLFEIVD